MKKVIITFTLFLLFFSCFSAPQAQALTENQENQLLENYTSLRKNYESLRENVEENYVKKSVIENMSSEIDSLLENDSSINDRIILLRDRLNSLDNDFSDLESDLDSNISNVESDFSELQENVSSSFENLENKMIGDINHDIADIENHLTTRIENSKSRLDLLVTGWENVRNNLDNRITDMKTTFGQKWRGNEEDLKDLKNNEKPTYALVLAVFGLIAAIGGGLGVHKRLTDGEYAKSYPKSAQTVEDRIWAALNLKEYRLKSEAPREEIESADRKCEVLRERYPDRFQEVLKDADLEEVDKDEMKEKGTEDKDRDDK